MYLYLALEINALILIHMRVLYTKRRSQRRQVKVQKLVNLIVIYLLSMRTWTLNRRLH